MFWLIRNPMDVIVPRGPLSARRMTAHWVVLAAAALTTLVAAAVGAALAVFAGQALPQAVRHDLSVAPNTSLIAQAPVVSGQIGPVTAALRQGIGTAIHGVPFGFRQGSWSDPLGLVPGKLPTPPSSAGQGNTPLLEAAAIQSVSDHAVLLSGHWPAAGAGPVQAALPASAATLLHVSVGDVLYLRDRVSSARITFRITGLFARRQESASVAQYWSLDLLPASGSSTLGGFTTYGPLLVDASKFPAPLAVSNGTWFAQPDMTAFGDTDLSAISGDLGTLRSYVANTPSLDGMQLTTGLD